jgi:ubiquinone/menaquinone biosynthesis C-methylase UbiE
MDKALYDDINQVEETHWWYRARREIIFDWVKRILSDHKSPRILDIGCGTGFNMTHLQRLGCNQITGLDFSPDALAYCRSHKLRELIHGDAAKLPICNAYYDIVLTLDIIEHLKDDHGALLEVYRILKPGGSLIVFVPAFEFLWSFQDEISHHQRRYTVKELREKVSQAGFQPGKLTYVNSLLFPIVWLGRIVLRTFPARFHITSENQLNPTWMNGILYRIFLLELSLLHFIDLPLGVSILCVCKKPIKTEEHEVFSPEKEISEP